ncbi:MAG: hypothetical protein Q9180_004413, partial [Flavoplaca navasiana]
SLDDQNKLRAGLNTTPRAKSFSTAMSRTSMFRTMEIQMPSAMAWTFVYMLLSYLVVELVITRQLIRKQADYPIVGRHSHLIPRIILNLYFAGSAVKILDLGYRKFKDHVFRLIRNDGNMVVLPPSSIDELSSLPPSVASPHGALEHDLLGPYTGLNTILDSRLHHSIVQRKLTPRLETLTPYLENELTAAVEDYFPDCDEWTTIQPFRLFGKLAARVSARALVGPSMCRDRGWLDVSINYTESLFKTIVIMRLFPAWSHPFISLLLPSYRYGRNYIKSAKRILAPRFHHALVENSSNSTNDWNAEGHFNVLTWLADTAKGRDRDPEALAFVEVLLALASAHTTLLRMVNVLYDLIANPGYLDGLQKEKEGAGFQGWSHASYHRLQQLDSVLRESQRMSPPTILGLKRLFKLPYTFSDGLHVTEGTYVCLPIFAIENDPDNAPNPERFDGLRSYRLRQKDRESGDHQFSTPGKTVLSFGYGKTACPGRHFASLMLKMTFVKLLTQYEFKFLPNAARPRNVVVHEFLFPLPWTKVLMRRRKRGLCPF